jgi:predicted short-subunit dehydrogenase-like oxidoreductase (DUF2520 family)
LAEDLAGARIILVGPGRAGRAFARSWTSAGGSIVLIARDVAPARSFARRLDRAEVAPLDGRALLAGDVAILSVPDDAIAPVAARLAGHLACRFAFHFSGALGSDTLAPLSEAGARLGSLHPLRAFSGSPEESWAGAFVAVEGEEPAARAGLDLCRRIGARPRRLPPDGKVLYHAAATLAAGGSASLLSFAARLWSQAGLDEEEGRVALAALAAGALEAVGKLPFERALTGPVARRDVATVRLHRDALAGQPELAGLYALLARETLRRTPGRGREREISALLGPENGGSRSGGGRVAEDSHNPRRNG